MQNARSNLVLFDSRAKASPKFGQILTYVLITQEFGKTRAKRYNTPMKTLVREEAQRLLQTLPDDATWDDVQYAILFRQSIARGMADSESSRGKSSKEVQKFATK